MKRWPTTRDLCAWYLYEHIDERKDADLLPEHISDFLMQFEQRTATATGRVELHAHLHSEFAVFANQFMGPNER